MEIALGFAIALAISLTGVGAGSMTTPLLILLLGVPPATAVGTALAFGAIVKVASVPSYLMRRQVDFRVLRSLVAAGIPGVLLGGFLLSRFKQGPHEAIVYTALGAVIVLTAAVHLYRTFIPREEGGDRDRTHLLPWFAFPISAEVGFSSAGAGALGSLALLSFSKLSATEVVGTDLCFGLVISAIGGLIQVSTGNYDGQLLAKLLCGGLCGALSGSLLSGRIAQRPLRIGLLMLLILLGSQLALHGHSKPQTPQIMRAALR